MCDNKNHYRNQWIKIITRNLKQNQDFVSIIYLHNLHGQFSCYNLSISFLQTTFKLPTKIHSNKYSRFSGHEITFSPAEKHLLH